MCFEIHREMHGLDMQQYVIDGPGRPPAVHGFGPTPSIGKGNTLMSHGLQRPGIVEPNAGQSTHGLMPKRRSAIAKW